MQAGLLAVALTTVLLVIAFTKGIPFVHSGRVVKAQIATGAGLRQGAPVRLAGVDVGKVTDISAAGPGEQVAIVTMRLKGDTPALHTDATLKIRPRLFLEGSDFVDLSPGTPQAPRLHAGDTIPLSRTAAAVQFDQILGDLRADVRRDLQTILREYGSSLTRGGARGYNRSLRWQPGAYRSSAIVNDAAVGEGPSDLAGYVQHAGAVAAALDLHPDALQSLVRDFNTTMAAFAARSDALATAISQLPRTLEIARPALSEVDAALPDVRRLARALRPAVRSTGRTIAPARAFLAQARPFLSAREAGGLARELLRTTPPLTRFTERNVPLQTQFRLIASCQNGVVQPWAHSTVPDAAHPPHGPVYQDGIKALTGLTGESRAGDANGQWIRVLLGAGEQTLSFGNGTYAQANSPILGINPPLPKDPAHPPLRPDVPCETQQAPDLRSTPATPPPTRNLRDVRDRAAERAALRAARKELRP
jgi:ABC-type transporter Mla subunit MlaD